MIVSEAVNDIVRKLSLMNDRELMATGRQLHAVDLTWNEWADELAVRVNRLRQGPSQDVLDALGALVIAHKINLAEAEETRVDSGAEDAA